MAKALMLPSVSEDIKKCYRQPALVAPCVRHVPNFGRLFSKWRCIVLRNLKT